ncbi:unnamed protein product [Ostreobium quekettii]|uniref:Uncharacterized protein n=1 Tax=Ostreobium quekettii TaxID=121088 RepID=A0A8S1ITH2_9CHLO|nr:unnamed protein product [Ostreobium quekettii]
MASPWAKPAAKVTDWSEQVDEEEAANGGGINPPEPARLDEEAFPSLGDAAKAKGPKKKRGGQKMSLGEFVGGGGEGGRRRIGAGKSDREIVMSLPTAPRERGPGEEDGGWGGGYRSGYGGGYRSGGFGDRDDRGGRDDLGTSRAEESDNWGSEKRFVPSGSAGGFRAGGCFGGPGFINYDRPRSSAGGRYDDAPLPRASDSDNWSRDNRFEPAGGPRGRSGFGGGFYEPPAPRRGYGFRDRDAGPPGGGFDRERTEGPDWSRSRSYTPTTSAGGTGESGGERPRLNLKARSRGPGSDAGGDAATPAKRSSIFGEARLREDVLRDRGGNTDGQSSRATPTSEGDSGAGTPASPNGGSPREETREEPREFVAGPPRRTVDPFGGARPREDNLGRRLLTKDAEEELSKGIEAM